VLIDTNLVIFGGGTQVSLVEPAPRRRPTGSPAIDTAKTR
jgi:hypothetical protein